MPKITVNTTCGNSPKQLFLRDFTIAIAEQNLDYISKSLGVNATWEIIGDTQFQGKNEVVTALELSHEDISELIIYKVLTHGKEGAVNGKRIMQNGNQYAFCDVYEFTGAKGTHIQSIDSYLIEMSGE